MLILKKERKRNETITENSGYATFTNMPMLQLPQERKFIV